MLCSLPLLLLPTLDSPIVQRVCLMNSVAQSVVCRVRADGFACAAFAGYAQAVEAVRRLTALASPFMAERMYDLDARHAVESRWCPITNAKAPF